MHGIMRFKLLWEVTNKCFENRIHCTAVDKEKNLPFWSFQKGKAKSKYNE